MTNHRSGMVAAVAALMAMGLADHGAADGKVMMAEPERLRGTFAFSNKPGTHLLAVDAIGAPARISVAVCPEGKRYAVVFEKVQSEGTDDTGRAVAGNFENMAGALFRVDGGPIARSADDFAGVVCVLLEGTYLDLNKIVAAKRPGLTTRRCPPRHRTEIAKSTGHNVLRCSVLALVDGKPVVLAELAPAASKLVAVLAVPGPSGLAMIEYETRDDPSKISCWRVDDGCQFPLDSFRILFALDGPDGFVLAIAWGAPEGELESLLRVNRHKLVPVVTGYRYWAPI